MTLRSLAAVGGLALLVTAATPALALEFSSPSNALCGLVNFRFCDQGAPMPAPPPSTYEPDVAPAPTPKKVASRSVKAAAAKKRAHKMAPPPETDAPASQN